MLQLNKPSVFNKLGKQIAKPLSRVITTNPIETKIRMVEAYIAFLQGKGAGAGWDIVEEVKAAKNFIYRNQPIVFDVGANVGLWSKHLLQLLPTAKIYLFEPSNACHGEICKLNLPNTVLIPSAIGKEKNTGILYSPCPRAGVASLYKRRDSYCQQENFSESEVTITTIDEILNEYSIDFVDFMKMDIEGNEFDALKGASQAFSNRQIGAFSFEFGSGNINSRTFFHDFWDLLNQNFYKLYRITPSGKLLEIHYYYEDLEYFRGASNYIAILKNHPYS
ncbi:FkbM family methyltransferase [Tolypothrix campylonemoides VB511288]|nr:FkbM family methyltransferase [Tolypothrix campylonemoides VB511288]